MPDEKDQKNEQQNKGGGSGQVPRPRRKPWNDSTNLLGALVWMISNVITSIALMLAFVGLPNGCTGNRGQIIQFVCVVYMVQLPPMWFIFGSAVTMQFLLSAFIWRIPNVVIRRVGYFVEVFVNFIGLYWLVCVQAGLWRGLYESVTALIRDPVSVLLGLPVLVGASMAWPYVEKALFNAPAAGAAQQSGGGQQRR